MKHVVVIGGGIAGLSSAYFLIKKSKSTSISVRVTVLEAEPRWGGKIKTELQDGFVIEGGPDTFLASKPSGVQLCRELGLEERLHGTNPKHKNTYVLHHGRLTPLPEGLTMMIPTQFSPMIRTRLLSWPAKFRMGMDFFLPPRARNGDESLGEFVSRRLGRPVYENLIEPLMSGIYAGDGDRLSLASTFPYLRDLELQHGGLVKGALVTRRKMAGSAKKKTGNRSAFLTPTNGLEEIIQALTIYLGQNGCELRAGAAVRQIRPTEPGYAVVLQNGEELAADGVILATPAYAAGDLIKAWAAGLARDLEAIPYVSTATISMAFRQDDLPRPLNGYGYVIPRREGRRALACTWTSTKFPHRAPEGYSLLRVFVGRAGQEEAMPVDPEGLTDLAREEIMYTLGINARPVFTRAFYWPNAMPQYNLGHPERLERIQVQLGRIPALALAGNGYRGIGIPDCIRSGEIAAEQLLQEIHQPFRSEAKA